MKARRGVCTVALCWGLAAFGGTPAVAQQDADTQIIPIGYGRLNQDNLQIGLRADNLDILMTILQESGLRLLNEESYNSMHRLIESKKPQIDSISSRFGVQNPGLLLVRFFALAEGARFDAQLLTANINGQFYIPIGIVPLSTSIQSDRLNRRQQVAGLYVFEEELTPFLTMGFAYASFRTEGWNQNRVERLLREQSRIQARVIDDQTSKVQEQDIPSPR